MRPYGGKTRQYWRDRDIAATVRTFNHQNFELMLQSWFPKEAKAGIPLPTAGLIETAFYDVSIAPTSAFTVLGFSQT